MELREIQTFLCVADQKSFSKAARQLGYSQAAVTIQIQNLEKELNTRLFDRIGRCISMTNAGHIFYGRAHSVLSEINKLREELYEKPYLDGELCIGAIESIGSALLPALLAKYHGLHPGVSVRVILDSPEALMRQLLQNTVDMVYLLDRRIYDPMCVKALEEEEQIVFVAAADHPLTEKKNLSMGTIIREPFVLTEKNASYRFTLDQYLAAQDMTIYPFLEISSTDFIIGQVERGGCISFLPEYVLRDDLRKPTIRALSVKGFQMSLWRQLLYHKDKWVTREMREFIALL